MNRMVDYSNKCWFAQFDADCSLIYHQYAPGSARPAVTTEVGRGSLANTAITWTKAGVAAYLAHRFVKWTKYPMPLAGVAWLVNVEAYWNDSNDRYLRLAHWTKKLGLTSIMFATCVVWGVAGGSRAVTLGLRTAQGSLAKRLLVGTFLVSASIAFTIPVAFFGAQLALYPFTGSDPNSDATARPEPALKINVTKLINTASFLKKVWCEETGSRVANVTVYTTKALFGMLIAWKVARLPYGRNHPWSRAVVFSLGGFVVTFLRGDRLPIGKMGLGAIAVGVIAIWTGVGVWEMGRELYTVVPWAWLGRGAVHGMKITGLGVLAGVAIVSIIRLVNDRFNFC